MRPVRMKRDDVVIDKRNRSGTGFPTCCRCWQPVHAVLIVDERKKPDGQREIDIQAECHGKRETKICTVPLGQTKEQFVHTIPLMVFFADASTQGAITRMP